MANEYSPTLALDEAADFVKIHWQTLRAPAKAGAAPGADLAPGHLSPYADKICAMEPVTTFFATQETGTKKAVISLVR